MNTKVKHNLNDIDNTVKDKVSKGEFKEMLTNDLQQNVSEAEYQEIENSEILKDFLDQVEKIDFELIAFPKIEKLRKKLEDPKLSDEERKNFIKEIDSYKLTRSHFVIIVIEEMLKIAKKNDWNMCEKDGEIYLFNGQYWKILSEQEFRFFLGNVSLKFGVQKFTGKYHRFKDDLVKQFIDESFLKPPKIDKKKVLINLRNGTYEISPTGQNLREFRSEDFLTYQLPFEYDPEAKCPLFKKYLNEVLPDQQRQTVLAEYLGYVFIKNGTLKIEKSLMCYGTGRNGKSVIFEIVKALLGSENVSSYSLEDLTKNKNSRAGIINKLVNYSGEISGRIDAGEFKTLSSGEPTSVKILYKDEFVAEQYAKLIFNANKLPVDVEHTDGFFERFLIIHFDQYIPEDKRDGELHLKIIDKELAGVFNWILDGLKRLLKNKKLSRCDSANNMLNEFRKESDSVKMFIEEFEFEKNGEEYTTIKSMYDNYKNYCIENGFTKVNVTNFMKRLQHHRILVERKSVGNVAYVVSKFNQDFIDFQ